MKQRDEFTNDELAYINDNFSWMSNYYKQMSGATIEKVTIGLTEDLDGDMLAFPVLNLKLSNGDRFLCDVVSAHATDLPGVIVGLPFADFEGIRPNTNE